MDIQALTYDYLKTTYRDNGYVFFDRGDYNLNIGGIRNKSPLVDEWNDLLFVAFREKNIPKVLVHTGTTKPGYYWLKQGKMGNVDGTFILCPSQYRNCWEIGFHNIHKPSRYEALVQKGYGIFKGWRDNDQDGELDYSGPIFDNVTGLNCHTESFYGETDNVGAYSAGCQVREFDHEHVQFMQICKAAAAIWGNSFSYTLFDEVQVYGV